MSKVQSRMLEWCLILITIGLACLLYELAGLHVVVLNLFYLPVVLTAFFLGRYRAGVLALLSVIVASIIIATNLQGFAALHSPIIVALTVTTWGAVLGLTALIVGTLSDERGAKLLELQEAYSGVVEVLARYLQPGESAAQHRSQRISKLCERVAHRLGLPEAEIDGIRIAALLHDLQNLEITARVISKAVGDFSEPRPALGQRTIRGTDLANSLSEVLSKALPLLLVETNESETSVADPESDPADHRSFGSLILRTVRTYDALAYGRRGERVMKPEQALEQVRDQLDFSHHPSVLFALQHVVESEEEELPGLPSKEPAEAEMVAV